MRAASISSSGMLRKNCRARKQPERRGGPGRMTDQYVPVSCSPVTSRNCATMIACTGIIIRRESQDEQDAATREPDPRERVPREQVHDHRQRRDERTITSELTNSRRSENERTADAKFSVLNVLGQNCTPRPEHLTAGRERDDDHPVQRKEDHRRRDHGEKDTDAEPQRRPVTAAPSPR